MRPPRKLRPRRRRGALGFSLVEAIVALTVAASTLLMISGATYTLSFAMSRISPEPDRPVDRLAAERLLRSFAARLAPPVPEDASVARPGVVLSGDAAGVVFRVVEGGVARSGVVRRAAFFTDPQNSGRRLSARLDEGREATLYVAQETLSFRYLVDDPELGERRWRPAPADQQLPYAVGVWMGDAPIAIAPVTLFGDAGCLSRALQVENAECTFN